MDIIINTNAEFKRMPYKKKAADVMMRRLEVNMAKNDMDEIYYQMEAYPNVNYRYFVQPSDISIMANGQSLLKPDNRTVTWPMQKLGRHDGELSHYIGEGKIYAEIHKFKNDTSLKRRYGNLMYYIQTLFD